MSPEPPDPVDVIADALARLRPRRPPRPPWADAAPAGGASRHRPEFADRSERGFGGPHGFGHRHGHPARGGRLGGPARMRLLEALVSAAGPLTVGEIADAVGVDQPRASRLVQQAVDLGLAVREADPDDARRTRVAVTDVGRETVSGFRDERRESLTLALASFTDAERDELARLLGKLADGWPG